MSCFLNTSDLLTELDEGEKQAIALAYGLGKGVLLLMDDYAGRQAARKLGVPVTGLIGLLLLGKEKGSVMRVAPLLDELRQAGYWLSDEIISIAKDLAGECPLSFISTRFRHDHHDSTTLDHSWRSWRLGG